jgi:hypothetical protein
VETIFTSDFVSQWLHQSGRSPLPAIGQFESLANGGFGESYLAK